MTKFLSRTLTALILLALMPTHSAKAQEDGDPVKTHSPYTLYGIGDMSRPGNVRSRGMGGISIGVRDQASVNTYNPSALSIQDSLVVMVDFAGGVKNTYSKSSISSTSANSFYFDYVTLSFRIGKGLTTALGLSTVSNIGYDIEKRETDPNLIYHAGDIKYRFIGEGNVNQVVWSTGYKLLKNLSLGVNFHYYFGSINRNYITDFETNSSFGDINAVDKNRINKIGLTLGLQYHMQVGNNGDKLTIGAIYKPKTNLSNKKETYTVVTSDLTNDTVRNTKSYVSNVFIPTTIGVGFTYKKSNKLVFGADYTYEDWSGFNVDGYTKSLSFKAGKSHTIQAGFEYTPKAFNIKNNLKRWNYRGGFRYSDTYMTCNGEKIKEYGILFGLGIPISRTPALLGTKINAAVEFGTRGTKNKGLIKENYITFTVGINIFDIWFRKFHYD